MASRNAQRLKLVAGVGFILFLRQRSTFDLKCSADLNLLIDQQIQVCHSYLQEKSESCA